MFSNNQLLSQLKEQIQADIPKKQGIVKATERGFGFLETDKGKKIFIAPNDMKNVIHGDKVTALIRKNGDKENAEPIELKKCETTFFVAKLLIKNNKFKIEPKNPLINNFFKIKGSNKLIDRGYKDGDWVKIELLSHGLEANGFLTQIVEKIASFDDPFAFRLIAIATYNLPSLPPECEYSKDIIDPELERADLTHLPFFTIDGENTQDMDDALYIEELDSKWQLTVAISDPCAYIPIGSKIDIEAKKRGFTHYLPNLNVPMLPRALSDDLCSLKEGSFRKTLCCKIIIGSDGEIIGEAEFFAAIINSHFRLNYKNVSDYLENEMTDWKPSQILKEQIRLLDLATAQRLDFRVRNNITFKNQPDYSFKLNLKGEVSEILCEPRRSANRLVEESMIAANICAGNFLAKNCNKGVFTTHSGVASDKLEKAAKLIGTYGLEITGAEIGTLDGYIKMRHYADLLYDNYLDHRLRKLLTYGDTSCEPKPHFTLGVSNYATWTSPIRKYGDLINHRLIKDVLLNQLHTELDEKIGAGLNEARKCQRLAERDVNNLLYCQYLKGQEKSNWRFKAEIFDIIKAGLRVRVQENGATFFIPSSLLIKNTIEGQRITCDRELGQVLMDEQIQMQLGDIIEVYLNNIKEANGQLIGRLADPLDLKQEL